MHRVSTHSTSCTVLFCSVFSEAKRGVDVHAGIPPQVYSHSTVIYCALVLRY